MIDVAGTKPTNQVTSAHPYMVIEMPAVFYIHYHQSWVSYLENRTTIYTAPINVFYSQAIHMAPWPWGNSPISGGKNENEEGKFDRTRLSSAYPVHDSVG